MFLFGQQERPDQNACVDFTGATLTRQTPLKRIRMVREPTAEEFPQPLDTVAGDPEPAILTIGHSTRSIDEFLDLLRAHGVRTLVDIRTIPRSRRNPQYAADALEPALAQAGVRYVHVPALGGLRSPRRDSPNGAWRNRSFRGYADHMQTGTFANALEEVIALSRDGRVALMCAEAVPWRCHRSLVADALTVRGVPVAHVVGPGPARPHRLSPLARVEDGTLTYPPAS